MIVSNCVENVIQLTLAIKIHGVTVTWLKQFDVMKSFIFLEKQQ